MKKIFFFFVLIAFSFPLFAENTLTLPQGRFRASIKPIYASKITSQFNQDKVEASLANKFEKELDLKTAQKLNPALAGAMGAFGVNTLGKFSPALELSTLVMGTAVEYGISNNLTLGVIIPIITANSKFNLDFSRSPVANTHPVFKSIDFVKAVGEAAVQKGYRPFENWDRTGLGDIEVGFKYRLLNLPAWALSTKAGFRFPTGRVDDPNHLTDLAFGDGQTDMGTTLLIDFKGIPHLLVNLMTKYTLQFPDKQSLRVPDEGELFTTKAENIKRDLGDRLDTALYGEFTFLKLFNLNASSHYFVKQKDRYKSDLGLNSDGLELNTRQMSWTADIGVGFSTLPWVREEAFALPMDIGVNFQMPISGQNVVKTQSVNLEYKLYF